VEWIRLAFEGVRITIEDVVQPVSWFTALTQLGFHFRGVEFASTFVSSFFGLLFSLGHSFFHDVSRIWNGNILDVSYAKAVINWSLGIDLSYSLTYIIGSLIMVLLSRNMFARTFAASILKFVVEHPKGPIAAVGVTIAALVIVVEKLAG
jgi:hypothetical protein